MEFKSCLFELLETKFYHLQAEQALPNLEGQFDISLYTSAAYIIIVVAAIVSIIAFFGCFGAIKVFVSSFIVFVITIIRRASVCLAPTSCSSLPCSLS